VSKKQKTVYNPAMIKTRQYLVALGDLCVFMASLALMLGLRYGSHADMALIRAHISAYSMAFIFPSTPRSPKPPGTKMASTLSNAVKSPASSFSESMY
jgi:hypothetical protein